MKETRQQDTYIVSYTKDGIIVEHKLPKEEAQRLYRQTRASGLKCSLDKEVIAKEKLHIPICDLW